MNATMGWDAPEPAALHFLPNIGLAPFRSSDIRV